MLGGSHSGFGRSFLNPICGFHCIKVVEMKRTLIAVLTAALAMAGVEAGVAKRSCGVHVRFLRRRPRPTKMWRRCTIRCHMSSTRRVRSRRQRRRRMDLARGEACSLTRWIKRSISVRAMCPINMCPPVTTVISAAFSEAWLAPVPFSNRHR